MSTRTALQHVYFFMFWRRLTVLLILSGVQSVTAQIEMRKVHIVTRVNNETYAINGSRILNAGDVVDIGLAIEARVENLFSSVWISNERDLIIDGDTIPTMRIRPWQSFNFERPLIRWYQILPANNQTAYYNLPTNPYPWAVINYQEVPIPEWNDRWTTPLFSINDYESLFPGTAWFKVAIAYQGQYLATAGIESRAKVPNGDYGGLSPVVTRLSKKALSGNRFVDHLLLFRNLPLIMNPGSWNGYWDEHQVSRWIGGDLEYFTVRAAELADRSLLGYIGKIPWPPANAYEVTTYYGDKVHREGDQYMQNGKAISLNRLTFDIGDFVITQSQRAVLYKDLSAPNSQDKGTANRILDPFDLVVMNRGGTLDIYPLGLALGDTLSLIRWQRRW